MRCRVDTRSGHADRRGATVGRGVYADAATRCRHSINAAAGATMGDDGQRRRRVQQREVVERHGGPLSSTAMSWSCSADSDSWHGRRSVVGCGAVFVARGPRTVPRWQARQRCNESGVMSCHVMSCHVMSYHVMSCGGGGGVQESLDSGDEYGRWGAEQAVSQWQGGLRQGGSTDADRDEE